MVRLEHARFVAVVTGYLGGTGLGRSVRFSVGSMEKIWEPVVSDLSSISCI